MKSGIIIVFVAVTAFAFAIPAIEDAKGGSDYFKKKLHEIQGAIDDTINAGKDLEDMEGALQNIVNFSSYFFRTESFTEYAVEQDAYENGWIPDGDSNVKSEKSKAKKNLNDNCMEHEECKSKICYNSRCVHGTTGILESCEFTDECYPLYLECTDGSCQ